MATKIPVRSDNETEYEEKAVKAGTVALTIAGIAAAASAVYLLGLGERAQQNREKVKSWAVKAREDIKQRLEDVKDTDLEEIGALIKKLKDRITSP